MPSTIKPSRIRGYATLLLGSAGAGLLGLAFDQLTVTISPEYFTLGKGLPQDGLRAAVGWLGFRSALPLGAWVAGLGLVRSSVVPNFTWGTWLGRTASGVAIALVVLPLTMVLADPFGIRISSVGAMSDGACTRYLIVWGMHFAAYLGLAGGTVFAFRSTRPTATDRTH